MVNSRSFFPVLCLCSSGEVSSDIVGPRIVSHRGISWKISSFTNHKHTKGVRNLIFRLAPKRFGKKGFFYFRQLALGTFFTHKIIRFCWVLFSLHCRVVNKIRITPHGIIIGGVFWVTFELKTPYNYAANLYVFLTILTRNWGT